MERVDVATQDEWAEFIQRVYRLDTGRWLQALVGRPGWHNYVARDGGEIAAARSMFIGPDGMAWLGIDGPVPGVHWDDYRPDAALCEFIVADGLAAGARGFIADIEAPSAALDTPAYGYFGRLGFSRPYVRTHWARSSVGRLIPARGARHEVSDPASESLRQALLAEAFLRALERRGRVAPAGPW